MSGTAHTPGPHTIEQIDHLGDPAWAVRAADGDLIAVGCLEGDATLFAAAPELLTSAVLLESLCTWLLHAYGPDSPAGKEASFRGREARAAIARATGAAS